jgi:tetratricopeptide (TPR) repeat protein
MIKSVIVGLLLFCSSIGWSQQIILKSESQNVASPILRNNGNSNDFSPNEKSKPFEPKQFKSLESSIIEQNHEVVLVGKVAPKGLNIFETPLFGGFQKNHAQLEEDKLFLKDADRNFENREKASYFFSDMGWQYLSEGSKEMAIYRYNLAYLLNPNNVDVFWGLGVIEYQKGELAEAIKLMTTGLEHGGDKNVTLLVDLATVHIKCFTENRHTSDMPKAYELLDKAITLKPNFANAYMQLALANLVNGDIDEAWMSFHKGYKLSPAHTDFELLSDLLQMKSDPMGLFK